MIARAVGARHRDDGEETAGGERSVPTLPARIAAVSGGLTAFAGVAGATPVAAGETTVLQTGGGIPVVGPTVILLGAILLAVALRLAERRYGRAATWGDGTAPEDATNAEARTSGSTAGRAIDDSSTTQERSDDDIESPATAGVGATVGDQTSTTDRIRHANGTFKTVGGGGTMMVTSPGFEPDLVVLTGASKGPAESTGFAEGWSHGVAHRTGTGDVDQYAVSIADTDGDATAGGIREDAALDLPVSATGAGTDAVWGKVSTTVDEGFQFEVSSPTGHERSSTVQYHAMSFPDGTDVSVGTFGFGSEPRKGKVDLGVDADFVTLTATTGARPLTRDAERPVAISHGTIVDDGDEPSQLTVGSALDGDRGSYLARNDRAIHLLHPEEDGIGGRTSMRVTSLGSTMRLTLEDIYEPAPVAFAVYAAVATDEDTPTPATGLVPTPGHERGTRRRVGTKFTPAAVSMSATAGAVGDDEERTVAESLPMLGWSHGVIGGTPGGLAGQIPIRTLVDGDRLVRNPLGTGIDDDAFVLAAMEDFEGELPLVAYTAWPGEMETET